MKYLSILREKEPANQHEVASKVLEPQTEVLFQ